MAFVVDASVAICWLMPDERDEIALSAYSRLSFESAWVPTLFWFELRNVFIVNERRGRIDAGKTHQALRLLKSLPIKIDADFGEDEILRLARIHRLTVYDAAYLELALRRGFALATLDAALVKAARTESATLIAPGAAR